MSTSTTATYTSWSTGLARVVPSYSVSVATRFELFLPYHTHDVLDGITVVRRGLRTKSEPTTLLEYFLLFGTRSVWVKMVKSINNVISQIILPIYRSFSKFLQMGELGCSTEKVFISCYDLLFVIRFCLAQSAPIKWDMALVYFSTFTVFFRRWKRERLLKFSDRTTTDWRTQTSRPGMFLIYKKISIIRQ